MSHQFLWRIAGDLTEFFIGRQEDAVIGHYQSQRRSLEKALQVILTGVQSLLGVIWDPALDLESHRFRRYPQVGQTEGKRLGRKDGYVLGVRAAFAVSGCRHRADLVWKIA
jgi:hypothetical protein